MRFKKFLDEMPTFDLPKDIACPFEGHSGEPINGNNRNYSYDTVSEAFLDKEYKQRMFKAFTPVRPSGIAPLICRKDHKMFMYNVDENIAYKAQTPEDIKFCEAYLEVTRGERFHDRNAGLFDFDRIEILK
jgi:hypothetical protein